MMHKFSDIAGDQLKGLGYEPVVKEWSAVWLWENTVGEKLSSVSRADKVKGHVLYVSVKNSSWAHHLSLMKREFLSKINTVIGEDLLKDIKFTVTHYSSKPTYRASLATDATASEASFSPDEVDLSEEVVGEIRDNASVIADCKLRSLFERVQLVDKKRKEWVSRHGGGRCAICQVPVEDSDICPVCSISRIDSR